MEAVRSAVGVVVGSVPQRKVQVVVDDPYNIPNGFAIPPIDWPLMVLWATPPTPRQEIGHFRSWGEVLAVHEFAHVAHLTWPTRNPFQRDLWRLLPAELGPVLRRSPRWVIEGYATYVEGRITGSGRPYSVWRPAVLRQWALEGRLPTYGQLSLSNAYEGGAFAYLAGSAYLEWLARREGDSSLVYLWRRLSARRNRSFGSAFSGLFGDQPDVLYGRFVAELTGNALVVERQIADAGGVVAGTVIQRLSWETGDPAISRDGRDVAVVLRAERRPSRLVVWRAGPDSVPPIPRRRRPRRLQPRDSLDVPDRQFYPPAKRAVATLHPVGGRSHEEPRFFADGERILVSRLEPRGDGSLAYDLFVWNHRRRTLRRVTRGTGIRSGDPSPDGRRAVATRCAQGRCDLVTVDLANGAAITVQQGSPDLSYHRPRYSPDGRRVAVSVQQQGRWRVGIVDLASRTMRFVEPGDGAARYDVSWLPSGRGLVWVSERGGIPNLEIVDLESGATRPVTRVTGAALAPEPNPADRSIWFLSLHSRGLDVRRLVTDSADANPSLALSPRLAPAVPVRPLFAVDTLHHSPVGPRRMYGIGPRQSRWFPGFSASADGIGGEIVLTNADPVGRLAFRLGGAFGERGTWRGGAVGATWRRRVAVTGEAYVADHEPSRAFVGASGSALDARITGGDLRIELVQDYWSTRHQFRVGGAAAQIDRRSSVQNFGGDRTRALGYAEVRGRYRQRVGELRVAQSLSAHADAGGIGADRFARGVISGGASVGGPLPFGGVHAGLTYGRLTGSSDPFERFVLGGPQSPLVDDAVLPQRIAMPALPTGVATGERVFAFRVALPTGPLWPYYYGASAANAGESFERWHRVVGAELRLGTEPLPLVAVPEAQLVIGYGRSLDEPYKRGNRFYAGLTYRR
jgi:Tol biopolymer transport system component